MCTQITNYQEDLIYQPVKNPITGLWEDQSGQRIRKNYKIEIICHCKAYLIEHCNKKYKDPIYRTNNHSYFIGTHIKSVSHKNWLEHKNIFTNNLLQKSNIELVERIEEIEREKRKDKVDFRKYLETIETNLNKEIKTLNETIRLKEHIISILESKIPNIRYDNLIDI